jgi:hypothetical protein
MGLIEEGRSRLVQIDHGHRRCQEGSMLANSQLSVTLVNVYVRTYRAGRRWSQGRRSETMMLAARVANTLSPG